MSIINEALKKAQQHLNQHINSSTNNSSDGKKMKVPFILPAILAGLIGYSIVFLLISLSKINLPNPRKPSVMVHPVIKTGFAPSSKKENSDTTSIPPPEVKRELILSGIITMDGEPVALINNQILATGDFIEGKKIIKITSNTVEISDQGKISVLKTGH